MEYGSDNYWNLYNHLEEKTKEVLKDVEEYLHSFEEYPTKEDAIEYANEMEQLNNYYIEVHDDGFCDNVIRLDVSYTEAYI